VEGNILTTIIALVVYLSTSIFGGGNEAAPPHEITVPQTGQTQESLASKTASVTADIVNMRADNSTDSKVILTLKKGDIVAISAEKDGWYQVESERGESGWLAKWAVKPGYFPLSSVKNGQEILGYYAESYSGDSRGLRSFTGNIDKISMIAPFSYRIDKNGNVSGRSNSEIIKAAKAQGVKTLAVVTNINGSNFSKETVSEMLRSSSARARTISGILRLLRENGYSGVNVDFEGVPPKDRSYLTTFFRELSTALRPHNLLVTAALPAKTAAEEWSAWSGAFDYKALSPYLDLAVIMTYDQHQANGPAGPVAAQSWVENVLKYSLKYISPNRLIMGIAAYGYEWNDRTGRALNYASIDSIIKKHGITPRWHEEYETPYFTYTKSGVKYEVWYENQYSTAAKMRLVNEYKLRGIAVWRLGYEDPKIWSVL